MGPNVTIAVSSRSGLRARIAGLLDRVHVVDPTSVGEQLQEVVTQGKGRVLIVDRADLPDDPTEYIDQVLRESNPPALIVVADGDEPLDRTRMLAAGATQVLSTMVSDELLGRTLNSIARRESEGGLHGPEIRGNQVKAHLSDFVSRSRSMQRFNATVDKVANADCPLLISGETGVGKERVARAVHAASQRTGPFIGVNCGAVPESLLESQLFGHERGAFTGAGSRHIGFFEQARGGIIFLDEVAELPLHLQVKLLTVLQRYEVQRLGGETIIPVDVRVITATNRDIKEEMLRGRFREDLYYRINVIQLAIPPLRRRVEDIPDLVGGLISFFRRDLIKTEVSSISKDALAALLSYSWPGNIRELINVIERAMILGTGAAIGVEDLPADLCQPDPGRPVQTPSIHAPNAPDLPEKWQSLSLKEAREAAAAHAERAYLDLALQMHSGRMGEVAKQAKIGTRSLHAKMQRHDLKKEDYRNRQPSMEATPPGPTA